jgi:hypothetical protein
MLIGISLIIGCINICNSNPKYCEKDDDCICSTNPCFLGNKKYFETCIANKTNVICLDACGFGPPEIEFKMICENNECKLATFNRTNGERLS